MRYSPGPQPAQPFVPSGFMSVESLAAAPLNVGSINVQCTAQVDGTPQLERSPFPNEKLVYGGFEPDTPVKGGTGGLSPLTMVGRVKIEPNLCPRKSTKKLAVSAWK